MRRGNFISGWMATAVLSLATVVASVSPSLAQRGYFRPAQGHAAAAGPSRSQPHPGQSHAGDWLRRYKGMTPGEQERALQSDPAFRRLSPEHQQVLRQRL